MPMALLPNVFMECLVPEIKYVEDFGMGQFVQFILWFQNFQSECTNI